MWGARQTRLLVLPPRLHSISTISKSGRWWEGPGLFWDLCLEELPVLGGK